MWLGLMREYCDFFLGDIRVSASIQRSSQEAYVPGAVDNIFIDVRNPRIRQGYLFGLDLKSAVIHSHYGTTGLDKWPIMDRQGLNIISGRNP